MLLKIEKCLLKTTPKTGRAREGNATSYSSVLRKTGLTEVVKKKKDNFDKKTLSKDFSGSELTS